MKDNTPYVGIIITLLKTFKPQCSTMFCHRIGAQRFIES